MTSTENPEAESYIIALVRYTSSSASRSDRTRPSGPPIVERRLPAYEGAER
jgi:hypothetical protein